jgi:hypothetical protein
VSDTLALLDADTLALLDADTLGFYPLVPEVRPIVFGIPAGPGDFHEAVAWMAPGWG